MRLAVLGPLVALGACADGGPSNPAAPTSSVAVSEAGAGGGAVLIRDETQTLFINVDAARGLISVHVPPAICQGAGVNVADRMIVRTPASVMQELFQVKDDDAGVVILEGTSTAPLFADFCGTLNGPSRIAAGTVRHTQTFTLASFAATWRGQITTTDGAPVQLTEQYQLSADLHDPSNPATWSENAVHIILHR